MQGKRSSYHQSLSACSGHAGSSFSWRQGHGSYAKPKSRTAWPQQYKSGARNKGQSHPRTMYAMPKPDHGNGGAVSTPNTKPSEDSGHKTGGGK